MRVTLRRRPPRTVEDRRAVPENGAWQGPGGSSGKGSGAIVVRDVSKVFVNRDGAPAVVLERVSLEVRPGSVTCLLGPSGCGKTTLLNLIGGIERPTDGHITVGGRLVTGIGCDRAIVFQQAALFPWLDVLGNIMVGGRAQGMKRADCRDSALELVSRLGLVGSERLYPYQLSGGMKQRVQIGRALLCQPAVLLMDEPFGALDAQTRLSLQELLLGLVRDAHPTIVFVTHDVEEATLLGNDVVVMDRGPGRVRECVPVAITEPRTYESLLQKEFIETKAHLLKLIRAPSL